MSNMTVFIASTSSPQSESVCQRVKDIFEDTHKKIVSGDVTVEELQHVHDQWDTHVVKMLVAISIDQHQFLNDLRIALERLSVFKLYLFLLKEFTHSFVNSMLYVYIYSFMHIIVSSNVLKNADECLGNLMETHINELCTELWTFPLFPEAQSLAPMLIQFAIMNSESLKNDVFYHELKKLKETLVQEPSLDTIHQNVWVPLFEHCCSVADDLKDEKITLSSLNKLFGSTDSADIEKTVDRLCCAVAKCCSLSAGDIRSLNGVCTQNKVSNVEELVKVIPFEHPDSKWVKEIARKITNWSTVHDVSNEADFVIKMFEVYGVDGLPFKCFCKQVRMYFVEVLNVTLKQGNQDFLQQTLGSLTEESNSVLLFLKKSRNVSQEVKKSITKLGECKELISFIRSKSKGIWHHVVVPKTFNIILVSIDVSEMERFIQIALDIVAGEGAEIQDRLIDLSELCGKFSSLIYQLTITAPQGIFSIMQLFQETLESLQSHDIASMQTLVVSISLVCEHIL